MEDDVEERDEREGFSVGGVKGRVGSTRDGGTGGGVNERLPARGRVGLENGVRVRDEATVLGACDELVAVSMDPRGRCPEREPDEGCEAVELVDGRRIRKEESTVYALAEDSASVEWEGEDGESIRGGR